MKNVVMGTAGHIDHGKTALVKRLTGIDTDRLEEEKKRGMTIELGFAPLKLPSGNVISVVDVPGHEKFIKTMVAGVSGIDFVMLVIAADEGIMPQTREHIDIVSLLNVKAGIVALTKVDLVDDKWLNLMEEDIRTELKGTFLEACDIMRVSAVTGEGIQNLIEKLEDLSEKTSTEEPQEFFRMPIDRVFTIQGHGTVITGTSLGGVITKGEIIKILPTGLSIKVREIQVHNKASEASYAGQRCALNLLGIEKSAINRGDVATSETWIEPIQLADAVLYNLKGQLNIKNNQRVHVDIGTKEVLARLTVIGEEQIEGKRKGYVQIRFEEPVVALRGDRFIIRSFSPVVTLGGGIILSHATKSKGRFKETTILDFKLAEASDLKSYINHVMKDSVKPLSLDEIWHVVMGKKSEVEKLLKEELADKRVIILKSVSKYMSKQLSDEYLRRIHEEFNRFYESHCFRYEIDKEEIKSKLFSEVDARDFTDLINYYIENKLFLLEKNRIRKNDDIAFSKIREMKETKMLDDIIFLNGLNVKSVDQLRKDILSLGNKLLMNNIEDVLEFLIRTERIINLGNDIIIHRDIFQKSMDEIRSILRNQHSISAGYLRDSLKCSRKTAISILEYLDSLGVTERCNDVRQPGVHYMDYFL